MRKTESTFDSWPKPRGAENCPPESTLVDWIRDPESEEARAHLSTCEPCRQAVEHARDAAREGDGNLRSFMLSVRSRAQREAEQHSSTRTVLFNYFSASRAQTVGVLAAVATIILVLTSGLWRQLGFLTSEPQEQRIVMDQDTNGELYRQALAELRDAYSTISSGSVSKGTTVVQIDQLNQALGKVDRNRLQPGQKQQLQTLEGQYQALVFDRFQPELSSSPGGARAKNLQTDFYSRYASYLAEGGEKLTVSPEVSLKSSKTKVYVIGYSEVPEGKKSAAHRAVQDLQNRVPDMSFEYKLAPMPQAAAAQPASASHLD
jgi:hypothetical protein